MAYADYQNMTDVGDILGHVNTATDGGFGIAVWGLTYLVLWTVITMAAARMGSQAPGQEAFMASSFMMAFITMLMAIMEWVPAEITVFPIVMGVVGLIIVTRKNT